MAAVMIGSFSLYEIATYFFLYAFLGWCCEVIYATLKTGKFVNRGFLNGPVCPIYGTGVVLLLLALTPLRDYAWVVFLAAALICSALEFITGFVLEKLFHKKWWDYSDRHFNLCGYICLEMSLLWGVAALAVLYALQPMFAALLHKLPLTAGYILLGVFAAALLTDLVFTLLQISALGKKYRELQKINAALRIGSDKPGGALSDMTARSAEKLSELKESGEQKLDDLRLKNARRTDALYDKIEKSRLAKAFPSLRPSAERREKLREKMRELEEKRKER